MESKRIAVVSKDSINVDDHFGMAEAFLIYDVSDELKFIEKRTSEKLSVGDPNHPFDADKFNRVYEAIKDCSSVYMTKIGEGPAKKLRDLGIEPVVYKGSISGIIA
jgi:predicted Fe-Mo cluster-binding NifX family protein